MNIKILVADKKSPVGEIQSRAKGLTLINISEQREKTSPLFNASYHFEKIVGTKTRYLLTKTGGEPVAGFPATYRKGALAGRQYIGMRKMAARDLYYNYAVCLELAKAAMFTGLNPVLCGDNKYRGFGDDRNLGRRDCILIEYSRDEMTLDVHFLFGKADRAADIFDKWCRSFGRKIE